MFYSINTVNNSVRPASTPSMTYYWLPTHSNNYAKKNSPKFTRFNLHHFLVCCRGASSPMFVEKCSSNIYPIRLSEQQISCMKTLYNNASPSRRLWATVCDVPAVEMYEVIILKPSRRYNRNTEMQQHIRTTAALHTPHLKNQHIHPTYADICQLSFTLT